jgi:hypothetical protein
MIFAPFAFKKGQVSVTPTLPIVSNGLTIYYDFSNVSSYPGSGTVVTDLSGNGNTGTLVNGPTFSSGDGGYITFDGSNDYLDTTWTGTSTKSLTLTIWVYLNDINSFRSYMGIDTSVAIDRSQFYFQKAGTTTLGMLNNYSNFQFPYPGNTNINIVNDSTTTSANTWYNFTATISSTQLKFYRNGTLINTVANTNPFLTPTGTLKMATAYYANNLVDFLQGRIGEAYVYNRPLTDEEVTSNFNNTKTRYGL